MSRHVIAALGLIGLGLLGGCSGGGNTALTTVPTAHLAITLPAATVGAGTPFTFTVTALDAGDAVVPTYIGTVHIMTSDPSATLPADSTLARGVGKFTVTFNTFGSHTITASDTVGDATSGTSAAITVSLGVSISPAAVTLPAGRSQVAFTATVEGTTNNGVIWSLQEGMAGGSITSAGVYTAPQTVGTYHVIAVSQADASKSAVATVTVVTPPPANTFKPTGSMAIERGSQTATLLLDGSVLVAGGCARPGGDYCSPLAESELYDPASGAFTSTGSMATGRAGHTATRLLDGKVLVVGGVATAELYDPSTQSFSPTGSMVTARVQNTATLLPDGKVLITGGSPGDGSSLASAELYDPATGSFSPTSGMPTARRFHSATLLQNGKVLIAGGENYPSILASAVLYDPSTDKFTPTGSMVSARSGHTATQLLDGRVLVVGGSDTWTSAELYDPKSGSFMATGSMGAEHNGHSATLLLDGRVLIAGGVHAPGNVEAELFDPAGGVFVLAGTMAQPRALHTATLLADGRVLVVGGCTAETADGCTQTLATAELYQ